MHWEIRPDRPVYLQLVEQMELAGRRARALRPCASWPCRRA